MPWATTADNVEIYYEDSGTGPTLVFVSGFFGIADIWHDVIMQLSDRYRCIAYDSRCYGRSDKPLPNASMGVAQHASDLAAVLDTACVGGTVGFVTHSMGGNIASTFALRNPDRVAGIVYTGTYLSGPQVVGLGLSFEALLGMLLLPEQRVAFFRAFGLPETLTIEAAKWPLYAVSSNIFALLTCDLGDRYGELTFPTLILQGGSDVVTPVEPCALSVRDALPLASLEVLDGVNHFPCVEQPGRSAELIHKHFRGIDRFTGGA